MIFIGIDERHPDLNRLISDSDHSPDKVRMYYQSQMSDYVMPRPPEHHHTSEMILAVLGRDVAEIKNQMKEYQESLVLLSEVLRDAVSS